MHTLVLCLWVLGIVSAADDQSERPLYIISPKGTPPGYTTGQPFYGDPDSSDSVKVIPNAYNTPRGFEQPSASDSPISIPVTVNRNTLFQGNTKQPIPVPVAYPDDGSAPTGQSQPALEYNPNLPIQRPPYPGVTPIPVLVKARGSVATPRPFQTTKPQFSYRSSSENPFAAISPSFRLWPKLPEPIPVPVLTTEAFARDFYRSRNNNLAPQYLQRFPVNAPESSNYYNQNPIPVRYQENSQFQTQPGQSVNKGPIYIIVPGTNNNAGSYQTQNQGSYQTQNQRSFQTQNQGSYQSQALQSGQGFIILAPPGTNSQSNQAYQNEGYSNQYFGNQLQGQTDFPPLNYAAYGPFNPSGSQTQAQTVQQGPLNYAAFGPTNEPRGANTAEQAPQNYVVLAPTNSPGSQPLHNVQSALNYPIGSSIDRSSFSSSTPPPPQYFGYSSTQSPSPQYSSSTQSSPQYVGYSSTQSPPQYLSYSSTQSPSPQYSSSTQSSPQYVGYSSTQSPPQYLSHSSTQSPSQQSNYSSSTQSPQYVGQSTSPVPPQTGYSTPVSRVSFTGAGSSYSYSIK